MYRISGIQFWQRRAQNDAAMRTRTHIKTLNSNFAPSSPFWACETIFCMYRISGIQFWYQRVQWNALGPIYFNSPVTRAYMDIHSTLDYAWSGPNSMATSLRGRTEVLRGRQVSRTPVVGYTIIWFLQQFSLLKSHLRGFGLHQTLLGLFKEVPQAQEMSPGVHYVIRAWPQTISHFLHSNHIT